MATALAGTSEHGGDQRWRGHRVELERDRFPSLPKVGAACRGGSTGGGGFEQRRQCGGGGRPGREKWPAG